MADPQAVVARAGDAQVAANQEHQAQQEEEAGGGGAIRTLFWRFVKLWLVYMLVKTVFLGSGGGKDGGGGGGKQRPARPQLPAIDNLWPPGTEFGLRVWLNSGAHNQLLWERDGLRYTEDQPEVVLELEDLPTVFREQLLRNQSVVARVAFSPAEPGRNSFVRSWPLTQWRRPPKPPRRRQHLLSGLTESDEAQAEPQEDKPQQEEFQEQRVVHWKPELSIRLVSDHETYHGPGKHGPPPPDLAAFYQLQEVRGGGGARGFEPVVLFDEFWLLRERFLQVNETVRAAGTPLPLRLSLSMMQPWKLRLQVQAERTLRNQARISGGDLGSALGASMRPPLATVEETGIDSNRLPLATSDELDGGGGLAGGGGGGPGAEERLDRQLDQLRAMFLDNNPWFLGLTFLVSLLHSVFDFLAFKNDISFWKQAESAKGLSVRSIGLNLVCGLVVFLYLLDNDTSWMILMSSGVGTVIEAWKLAKCVRLERAGLRELRLERRRQLEQRKQRREEAEAAEGNDANEREAEEEQEKQAAGQEDPLLDQDPGEPGWELGGWRVSSRPGYTDPETNEYDREAIRYLSWAMYPLLAAYAVYSLLWREHRGWYSYLLETAVGAVYSFGFVLMCPQLWVNYRLKSVSHLPWRMLSYKFLNTIIDDLFAFVIRMPLLHRLSCFRDDLVFLVFLYQKWIYRTDYSRTNEFGFNPEAAEAARKQQEREREQVCTAPAVSAIEAPRLQRDESEEEAEQEGSHPAPASSEDEREDGLRRRRSPQPVDEQ